MSRIPKGMDLLLHLRGQGVKPAFPVWVFLDQNRPRERIYCDMPITCDICVLPSDDVSTLDFRGLVGLSIVVFAERKTDRLRALLKAIVKASPEFVSGAAVDDRLLFVWKPNRGWESDVVEC